MCDADRRALMTRSLMMLGAVAALGALGVAAAQTPATPATPPTRIKWVCPPCGCAADGKEYDAAGSCPECGMTLIQKALPADPATVKRADASPPKPATPPFPGAKPTPSAAPTPPQ